MILVTGGAGFIGSEVVRQLVSAGRRVVVVDNLTYAGSLDNLANVAGRDNFAFEREDIRDGDAMRRVFADHGVQQVIHLAAESHVDRSIDNGMPFIQTNVIGTANLLEAARDAWSGSTLSNHRFTHVSTDEVYGDLTEDEPGFTEQSPYKPSSPYSASKAASDHLVTAWGRTHQLPYVTTNCSNNYGPYQFPEKLIPLTISRCLRGQSIPVYGNGRQIRDWIHVTDHARGVIMAHDKGRNGESYLLGSRNEQRNLDLVHRICDEMNLMLGRNDLHELITFVQDRKGHDLRYAINPAKAESELGWSAGIGFETGLRSTIKWYVDRYNEGTS
ncbi:dTDP-glucose 4,6-dehydratase [Devosia subaequoris]|uniref:dTDP-glucose 4,6-dehydratase n=1 Tax=Devosia subaequoris TaxID=395930 RepID=A0A7W6IKL2_9HYPH|nr:dTDP-glucose 4,6-dehydratase [Devosia subaequoris]MBB4051290.1 dTDP-glucose 4,6-dehydratase [Devosia subaequoris]MCP1211411.1 dTDP-glucose 4,6-dehydratase [Devosia subaequoris]